MKQKTIDKYKCEFAREFRVLSKDKNRKIVFNVQPELSFIFPMAEKMGLGVKIESEVPTVKGIIYNKHTEISLF